MAKSVIALDALLCGLDLLETTAGLICLIS